MNWTRTSRWLSPSRNCGDTPRRRCRSRSPGRSPDTHVRRTENAAVSRWRLLHDRFRDLLIAAATAWALAALVQLETGSPHVGAVVLIASWLPLFAIARLASGEHWRRTLHRQADL